MASLLARLAACRYRSQFMRILLMMWLAIGMVPGLGEFAETVVHLATSGHLPHTDADHGDLGDQGHEHGCGTTQHRCDCCASQSVAMAPQLQVAGSSVPTPAQEPRCGVLASIHEPTPPFRPPIAS